MPRELATRPSDAFVWESIDLGDLSAQESMTDALATLRHQDEHRERSLFHDPAWLLEAEGRVAGDVRIYVCRSNGQIQGYAPFVVQPWRMRFRIGEITLFSIGWERLHIQAGPLVAATNDPQVAADLVVALLVQMHPRLARGQVIYLEGVVLGGDVDRAIRETATGSRFDVVEPSGSYERRLIRFPQTFDDYARSLKGATRQNLRNTQRKLEKHMAGNVRLVRCTAPDQVADFVTRAVAISRKTYQWHLLGLGLRNPDELQRTLLSMATRGWTRCYLLECGDTATAFMIGYLYSGTYYYVDVGFDPDWEKWSVGTVLHLMVLRELMDGGEGIQWFDFSSGSGVHKKRFANESRPETNYLLVPRSFRNKVLLGAYRGFDAASTAAVALLDKLHVKATIKKVVRRLASRRASDA